MTEQHAGRGNPSIALTLADGSKRTVPMASHEDAQAVADVFAALRPRGGSNLSFVAADGSTRCIRLAPGEDASAAIDAMRAYATTLAPVTFTAEGYGGRCRTTLRFASLDDAKACKSFLDAMQFGDSGTPIAVTLQDGADDSATARTVHVASMTEAQTLRDYLRMTIYSVRATAAVAPPAKVEIVNQLVLPDRKTETTITRDNEGKITHAHQLETSVPD